MKFTKIWSATAILTSVAMFCGCTPVNEIKNDQGSHNYISPDDFICSYLSAEEKLVYDELLTAVNGFESSVSFKNPTEDIDLEKIFSLIYTQESGIFWLDSFYIPSENNNGIELVYRNEKDEAYELRAELQLMASNILAEYYSSYNEYDAVKHFHDEIVLGCEFSKTGEFVNSAYGALVDGFAKCEGYAFAMSYLCDEIGLQNYVVTGEDKDGNSHAWNRIKIYDNWYNVDCTWDDPILKTENPNHLRHNFMLVSDEDIIAKTHFPNESIVDDIFCNSSELNYFLVEDLLFDSSEQTFEKLPEIIKDVAVKKDTEIEFRILDISEFLEVKRILNETNSLKAIVEELNSNFGLKIKSAEKSLDENMRVVHISLYF